MTTSYFLSPNSYICPDARFCILLDARSDKYIAIDRQTMEALAPYLTGWPIDTSRVLDNDTPKEPLSIANNLVLQGTFTTDPDHGKPFRRQNIPKPLDELLETHKHLALKSTLSVAVPIATSLNWARTRLSQYSLISTIHAIIEWRALCHHSSNDIDLIGSRFLVNAFMRWLQFYSKPNACLLESLALLHFLAKYQVFPSLVFGVISEPFHSHCWLQIDSMLINDTMSRISQFRPIMLI